MGSNYDQSAHSIINALRAENTRLDLVRIDNQQSLRNWMTNYHELQARAKAAEKALVEYGEHMSPCGSVEGGPCTCGFDAARAAGEGKP
jgi:hypothetical protein